MHKSILLSFTVVVLCAGVALAKGSGSGTQTVKKVTINGTAASASAGNIGSDGQCVSTGYPWIDNYTCKEAGKCECDVLNSPTVSGSGLKTVSDYFITTDKSVDPATQSAVDSGPSPVCNLTVGGFTVEDQHDNSTSLNFLGMVCHHVTGITSKNPSGTHDKDELLGGWGVASTPPPTESTSGWGTYTGTINHTTQAFSTTLTGWITIAN